METIKKFSKEWFDEVALLHLRALASMPLITCALSLRTNDYLVYILVLLPLYVLTYDVQKEIRYREPTLRQQTLIVLIGLSVLIIIYHLVKMMKDTSDNLQMKPQVLFCLIGLLVAAILTVFALLADYPQQKPGYKK